MYNNDEKTINLTDLCLFVLRRWKQMVVAALVLAVIAAGVTYLKSAKAYKDYQKTVQLSATEVVETVKLSEDEKAALQAKIDVIEENKENIAEYDYYLEKSIKAKLNPNNFYEGVVTYVLSSDNNEDIIKALELCYAQIGEEKNYESLAKSLTDNQDTALLKEVILATDERYVVGMDNEYDVDISFVVTVQHFEKADCEKMLTFFESELDKMQEIFEEADLKVSFEKVTSGIKTRNDRSLVTLSKDIKNAKSTAYDAIANIESNMTDVQKEYYVLSKGLNVTNTETEEELVVAAVSAPSVDMKIVVIAAFAGAFLIAGLYGVFYLFSGHVHNKEELESWLNVPVLEGNEAAEMIVAVLSGIAARENTKKMYITGSFSKEDSELVQILKGLLAKDGVDVIAGNSILQDAKALQDASECGTVVFVEKCNVSKEKDIKEELDKAVSCGIKVLGIVLEK